MRGGVEFYLAETRGKGVSSFFGVGEGEHGDAADSRQGDAVVAGGFLGIGAPDLNGVAVFDMQRDDGAVGIVPAVEMDIGELGIGKGIAGQVVTELIRALGGGLDMEDDGLVFLQGTQTQQPADAFVNIILHDDFLLVGGFLHAAIVFLGGQDIAVVDMLQREEDGKEIALLCGYGCAHILILLNEMLVSGLHLLDDLVGNGQGVFDMVDETGTTVGCPRAEDGLCKVIPALLPVG